MAQSAISVHTKALNEGGPRIFITILQYEKQYRSTTYRPNFISLYTEIKDASFLLSRKHENMGEDNQYPIYVTKECD